MSFGELFRRKKQENNLEGGGGGGAASMNSVDDDISEKGQERIVRYRMPSEESRHEGTWLQWPHNYGWDKKHVQRYEQSWVEMTRALHTGERVHIIVYNHQEKERVSALLQNNNNDDGGEFDMSQIDFYEWPTDDVWIRDNGPIFVIDEQQRGEMIIQDWGFNGWGKKADWKKCNQIPSKVGEALGMRTIKVDMVNEGGSVELDGRGTLLAKKSSILNRNRNPGWTQKDVEECFSRYLGVTNFIWLNGRKGQDVTDDHIDGTARFIHGDTIVTMAKEDQWNRKEYDILKQASDANGKPYKLVELPVTTKKIPKLKDYGLYINFYVANEVVLVPSYGDPNDAVAASILQMLFPEKKMASIPCLELAKDGGMIHCVTQQQPDV